MANATSITADVACVVAEPSCLTSSKVAVSSFAAPIIRWIIVGCSFDRGFIGMGLGGVGEGLSDGGLTGGCTVDADMSSEDAASNPHEVQ